MIIGSTYFFKDIEDFKPKDIDTLELVDNPKDFKYSYQLTGHGKCIFKWKKMSPIEFIQISLSNNCPMELGKFLIPEFCKEIGFTIDDLKQLQTLRDTLDDKHKYEAIIFDAYVDNDDFYLTDEQLNNAYQEYKKYRNLWKQN